MTRLRERLFALLPLVALLAAAALLPAAPMAGDDKKPAGPAADPLPEGARLRLGSGHFRHGGAVTRIIPLPDGKRLLTIAQDSRGRVWDIATEKELFQIAFSPQPFGGVVFSVAPDGKALAAASTLDRTIRLWNLADGKELQAFAPLPPNQAFLDLEYSADGKMLVSSHQDRVFRVWDVAAGKELRTIGQPNNINVGFSPRVRFTPDGKELAVMEEWAVRALDAEDGKEVRWFGGHTGPVAGLTFSPDGKRMATVAGYGDRAARVWDLATGKTVVKLPLPTGGGRELSFAGDGKALAVACNDRTVRVFDAESAKQLAQVELGPALGFASVALSRDGKTIYASSGESVVRGYDVATGKELYPVTGHVGGVQALVWSPDGKLVATSGTLDRSIILWDAASGKVLRQLPPLETYATTTLQFAPDGKALLSYGTDRTVRAWDVGEGKELRSFMVSPAAPFSFAFSRDGKLAAAAAPDRKVRVWDVAEGKELHKFDVKPAAGQPFNFYPTLSFAGDNRTLLGYSPNERVKRRWDAVTGKELGETKETTSPYGFQSSVSADSRSFVTIDTIDRAKTNITEMVTGKVRQVFTPPPPPPPAPGAPPRPFVSTTATGLSPDGRTVATVTTDNVLHFWDTGSGKELVARKSLPVNSRLLTFAPDGKTLASAGGDASVMLWDVPGPAVEGRLVVKDIAADKLDDLWKDLGGDDAARAWQAILSLASAPKVALPLVQKQLKPGAALDAKAIAKLIADLDAEEFQQRENATEALVRAGKVAEEAVKKALENKPSAEAKQRLEFVQSKLTGKLGPSLEEVRAERAVELLERIGTAEAQKLLEEFAKGEESKLSVEARAAVDRLKAKGAAE